MLKLNKLVPQTVFDREEYLWIQPLVSWEKKKNRMLAWKSLFGYFIYLIIGGKTVKANFFLNTFRGFFFYKLN